MTKPAGSSVWPLSYCVSLIISFLGALGARAGAVISCLGKSTIAGGLPSPGGPICCVELRSIS